MKKKIALALALLILSGTLVSCSSDDDNNSVSDDTTADTTTAAETTAAENEPERPALELPSENFDGAEFRFLAYRQNEVGQAGQFSEFGTKSESSGETINDAVYDRNMIIENRYNVVIVNNEVENARATARSSILAGDDEFDVSLTYIEESMLLAQDKLLLDLNEIKYLDLEAEWWDQAMRTDLSINGKQFTATGDILMSSEELMNFVGLNKQMLHNYDLEDPYKLVLDGQWTLDTMAEMSRQVTHDADGDGELTEADVYGGSHDVGISYYVFSSSGSRIAQLDSNGKPELTLNTPRAIEVIEKIAEIYSDPTAMLMVSKIPGTWTTNRQMFIDNRIMFQIGSMYVIQTRRDMISDFGILPVPKFDEAQDSYYHMPATQLTQCITVPTTNDRLDMTGILLEAFAYESKDTVVKAYYDYNLKTKISRDEESKAMLDIIFGTCCYDIGIVFGWGNLKTTVVCGAVGTPGTFASKYEAAESTAKSAMEKTYESFIG